MHPLSLFSQRVSCLFFSLYIFLTTLFDISFLGCELFIYSYQIILLIYFFHLQKVCSACLVSFISQLSFFNLHIFSHYSLLANQSSINIFQGGQSNLGISLTNFITFLLSFFQDVGCPFTLMSITLKHASLNSDCMFFFSVTKACSCFVACMVLIHLHIPTPLLTIFFLRKYVFLHII